MLPLLTAVLFQVPQASVTGVVREADSGTPIEGASVLLGDLVRGTTSSADGRYVIAGIPAGPQHLTISAFGHARRTVHALVPRAGTLVIDVALAVEPIELAALVVRPPSSPAVVEDVRRVGSPDRAVSLAAIRAHPMLAEPDALLALGGGSVSVDPEAPSGLYVHGGAADQTGYELDGFPVFGPVHAAGLFGAWNPDVLGSVSLSSSAPAVASSDALSGVVSGHVRDPGTGFSSEGTLTTTHASVTAHGSLPLGRAGYVASARSGLVGALAPRGEASYLRGESGDGLIKLDAELDGGALGILFYSAENELVGSSSVGSRGSADANHFEWTSGTLGVAWSRSSPHLGLDLKAWRATGGALARWNGEDGPRGLESRRSETGAQATMDVPLGHLRQQAGARVTRSETAYDAGAPLRGGLTLPTLFTESAASLGRSVDFRLGASLTAALGRAYVSPRGQLGWTPAGTWSVILSVARMHQFTQSLANPESVVRHVFPAELAVVAGVGGVPVPRSDQVVLSVSWEPLAGLRMAAEGYARAIHDFALVAPVETGPFSSGSFEAGSASVRGASLEASSSGARFLWLARYGWQGVELRSVRASYTPSYGVEHTFDAGLALYPVGTLTLRLGMSGGWGRTATDASAFEWESCNLLDLGCELAGSPTLEGPVGQRHLAPYLRLDLGARKHWHVRVAHRESVIGLFGTVTNVLGRQNELVWAEGAAVEMRPLSPLVLGLDWRF